MFFYPNSIKKKKKKKKAKSQETVSEVVDLETEKQYIYFPNLQPTQNEPKVTIIFFWNQVKVKDFLSKLAERSSLDFDKERPVLKKEATFQSKSLNKYKTVSNLKE